jgi:phospholipid/cholesterol/gamma-HCH transport system substrate-binding protein
MDAQSFITPFKVGLLVIAGIIASIFLVTRLTSDGDKARDYIEVRAYFDDVTGLSPRSRIRLAGIAVGEIKSIQLEGQRARVDILVRRDIELFEGIRTSEGDTTFYKNGALVAKKQASFIGDYYLEIVPGQEGPKIADGGIIHNVNQGNDFEQIFKKLNKITGDIEQVTNSLAGVLGGEDGEKGLRQILTDLQSILRTIEQFVSNAKPQLDQIVSNINASTYDIRAISRESRDDVDEILADARAVARSARGTMDRVENLIGRSSGDVEAGIGTLRGALARLQSTLDSLNYSLQNIQDITDKINEGEGTLGSLVNDKGIAEKTDSILSDVDSITGVIGRLRTVVQLRGEYHLLNDQYKTAIGLRLEPRPDKFYLLEFVDDYRGATRVTTRGVRTDNAGVADPVFFETTEETTDDFRVSVVMGYTTQLADWFAITGRFGIIESTGGAGGNLLFFDDRSLNMGLDIFDFDFNLNPRLRAMFNYDLLYGFYIGGGIDDILNARGRDYFLTLGFSFTDEDLKGLIATTGVPGN